MKKLFSFAVAAICLLLLISCSSESKKTKDNVFGTDDINLMSAEDAYAFSLSKKNKTDGAHITVTERRTSGGEVSTDKTDIFLRADTKTDYFFLEKTGNDFVCYSKKTLYVNRGEVRFSSQMAQTEFEDYFYDYIGDKWYFGAGFANAEKNGNVLTLRGLGDKNVLSLISKIPASEITDALGSVTLGDGAFIEGGKLVVTSDSTKFELTIDQVLIGKDNVNVDLSELNGEFMTVSSPKAPTLLMKACENLKELRSYRMLINSSDAVLMGGNENSVYYSATVNVDDGENGFDFSIVSRTLSNGSGIESENILTQTVGHNTDISERKDDLSSAKKLSEWSASASDIASARNVPYSLVTEMIPDLRDVTNLEYSETSDKCVISFKFSNEKIKSICQKDLDILAGRGVNFDRIEALTLESIGGTVSFYKSDLSFDNISFNFSARIGEMKMNGTYSMLRDLSSPVEVETIEAPDYAEY